MLSVAMNIGSCPDIAVLLAMHVFYKYRGDDGKKAPVQRDDKKASASATEIHTPATGTNNTLTVLNRLIDTIQSNGMYVCTYAHTQRIEHAKSVQ